MVDNMELNLEKLNYDELLALESAFQEFIDYLEDLLKDEDEANE